jgi:hypothetical protein
MEVTDASLNERLREGFATAEVGGAKLSWAHGFGFGATQISVEIDLPDGSQVTETIKIQPLLMEWAKQILNENGVTA